MAADIDALYEAMRGLYGNRWTSTQGEFDESGNWERELRHHTDKAIQRGLMRCREQIREAARQSDVAWPPQAAEFAIMCEPTPTDYGMSDAHDAWLEVCHHCHAPEHHHWSHAAVRMAGRAVGFYDIEQATSSSRRKLLENRFTRQYQALVNRVMAGQPLESQALLESDHAKPVSQLAERYNSERANDRVKPFQRFTSHAAAIAECKRQIGARA